jgi:error-prone DNA polymerase
MATSATGLNTRRRTAKPRRVSCEDDRRRRAIATGRITSARRAQIARELDPFEKLALPAFLLGTSSISPAARHLVQGGEGGQQRRVLQPGITAVDPVGMDLFERFCRRSAARARHRSDCRAATRARDPARTRIYGWPGAAMTANVITYRGRSAAREVGKARARGRAGRSPGAVMNQFEFQDPAETLPRHLTSVGLVRFGSRGCSPVCGARCRIRRGISASIPAAGHRQGHRFVCAA